MTLRRATLYIGGGSLLVAWFSSAASLSIRTPPRAVADPQSAAAATDGVAEAVQAQTRRLRQRIAAAPLPQQPLRNPFAFRPAPVEMPSAARVRAAAEPLATELATPAEPRLELAGIAEQRTPDGAVRTAMIATEANELIMATVGAAVAGRYTVTAIDGDGVSLTETATGRTRRLVLQVQ
jgi:hypothetical protein